MGNKSKFSAASCNANKTTLPSNPQPAATGSTSQMDSEHPTRISHGFWLQQYTCLHQDGARGVASLAVGEPESANSSSSAQTAIQMQGQRRRPRSHNKLLARGWINLMRVLASPRQSAAHSAHSTSGSSSAPATASSTLRHKPSSRANTGAHSDEKGRLSSSTSALTRATAGRTTGPSGEPQHMAPAPNPTRSPYRQIAKAFSRHRKRRSSEQLHLSSGGDGFQAELYTAQRDASSAQTQSQAESSAARRLDANLATATAASKASQRRRAGQKRHVKCKKKAPGKLRRLANSCAVVSTNSASNSIETSSSSNSASSLGSNLAGDDEPAPTSSGTRKANQLAGRLLAFVSPLFRRSHSAMHEQMDLAGKREETTTNQSVARALQQAEKEKEDNNKTMMDQIDSAQAESSKTAVDERSFLPLIQPLASSPSSLASISGADEDDSSMSSSRSPDKQAAVARATSNEDGQQPSNTNPLQASQPASASSSASLDLAANQENTSSSNQNLSQANAGQEAGSAGGQNVRPQARLKARASLSSRPASQPSGGGGEQSGLGVVLKSNFKKLVKRQQSVDSYRMAREQQRNKLKRRQATRTECQSNEAIKSGSVEMSDFSLGVDAASSKLPPSSKQQQQQVIVVLDPYAQAGSFTLPGQDKDGAKTEKRVALAPGNTSSQNKQPVPPSSLSLRPNTLGAYTAGTFSGCITPTYPTHHLPSPKYVPSPIVVSKKYSNASTVSSLGAGDSAVGCGLGGHKNNYNNNSNTDVQSSFTCNTNQSDTDGSLTTAPNSRCANEPEQQHAKFSSTGKQIDTNCDVTLGCLQATDEQLVAGVGLGAGAVVGAPAAPIAPASAQNNQQQLVLTQLQIEEEQAAAARRANLAEHIYDNKCGLGEDMKFLASLPELCDITFLVGETREPVCAVKSVLAARSRVFHKIFFGNKLRARIVRQRQEESMDPSEFGVEQTTGASAAAASAVERRDSSPRPLLAPKSSSPVSRSNSPNQQWSVLTDASGYTQRVTPTGQTAGAGDERSPASRSGRSSAAGADSLVSHTTSIGSQTPLVIGPGQTCVAAPAKRTKKSSIRDSGASRLSRMFMKRASDPSIKQQNHPHQNHPTSHSPSNLNHHHHHHTTNHQSSHSHHNSSNQYTNGNLNGNQSYLDKMSSSQMSTTMIIEEFEPDVFRQLIEYIHTGCVLLQARTLLGLLNAADYYGLEQLRKACLRFVSCCITVDTVCSLLSTAERYIQYKCTKSIVQKVLEFVDTHADEIFKLNAFGLLPEHVVRLILSRDGLQADEHVKYNGVYTWCEHYCRSYELTNISDVMHNFLDLIQFHKIPTSVLLSEIYPTHVVPDHMFLSALAYQADPQNFISEPSKARRMTLPNPQMLYNKNFDAGDLEADEDQQTNQAGPQSTRTSTISPSNNQKQHSPSGRKQSRFRQTDSSDFYGSQAALGRENERKSSQISAQSSGTSHKKKEGRKSSIAQVSLSGMMKLSHRLSIKKRHSNLSGHFGAERSPSSGAGDSKHRRSSGASSGYFGISSGSGHSKVSKQQSAANERDPLQVGQQILNAYLIEQQQRELERKQREEEERRQRELLKRQAQEEAGKTRKSVDSQPSGSSSTGAGPGAGQMIESSAAVQRLSSTVSQQLQLHQTESSSSGLATAATAGGASSQSESAEGSPGGGFSPRQAVTKSQSASRKSFKDFKHIPWRLFMRHSSSKMLQQQQSSSSSSSTMVTAGSSPSGRQLLQQQTSAQLPGTSQAPIQQPASQQSKENKRRTMFRIRRSETVFEAASSFFN